MKIQLIRDAKSFLEACREKNLEYIKKYLDAGGNIETRDFGGWTALIYASAHGHKDIVGFLLERGADIEAHDHGGSTALMVASEHGQLDVVKFLLNRKANIETQTNNGQTALMIASRNNHKNVAKLLLDRGANIDVWNCFGQTALMIASECGREDIVKLLLDRGADVEAEDTNGWTAFILAFLYGKTLTARHLARFMIVNKEVKYLNVRISLFIFRGNNMTTSDHAKFVKELVLIYMERAVKDPMFANDMQRDIEKILGEETEKGIDQLTDQTRTVLMRILNTLRSIDYTDRVGAPKQSRVVEDICIPKDADGRIGIPGLNGASGCGRSKTSASGDANGRTEPEGMSSAYDMEL